MVDKNTLIQNIMANTMNGKAEVICVNVTPELAKLILENNSDNRRLRQSIVDKYTNDMRNEQWRGESENMIVITKNGNLENGQHRLAAIVQSGLSQVMWIMLNADPAMYEIIDNGFGRKPEDYLHVENRSLVATLAGVFYAMVHGTGTMANCMARRISRNVSATRNDILLTAREYNNDFQRYIEWAKDMSKRTDNKYRTHIATALLMIDKLHQGDKLEAFVRDFQNICTQNPIIAMCRERMLANNTRIDKVDQRTYNVYTLLTAYELYRQNKKPKSDKALKRKFGEYSKTQGTYEKLLKENRDNRWTILNSVA